MLGLLVLVGWMVLAGLAGALWSTLFRRTPEEEGRDQELEVAHWEQERQRVQWRRETNAEWRGNRRRGAAA